MLKGCLIMTIVAVFAVIGLLVAFSIGVTIRSDRQSTAFVQEIHQVTPPAGAVVLGRGESRTPGTGSGAFCMVRAWVDLAASTDPVDVRQAWDHGRRVRADHGPRVEAAGGEVEIVGSVLRVEYWRFIAVSRLDRSCR